MICANASRQIHYIDPSFPERYTCFMDLFPMEPILSQFPRIQAVYLFGSCADAADTKDSDIDISLLLPHEEAKAAGSLVMSPLRFELENRLGRKVDLVNLRLVSTVFQKEIIASENRVFCVDENAADTFEMLVLSLYGKLNEERSDILASFHATRRAYAV